MTQAFGVAPLIPLLLPACSIGPDPVEADSDQRISRIVIESGSLFQVIDDSRLIHPSGISFDLIIESAVVADAPGVVLASSGVSNISDRKIHAPEGILELSSIEESLVSAPAAVMVTSLESRRWRTIQGRLVPSTNGTPAASWHTSMVYQIQ